MGNCHSICKERYPHRVVWHLRKPGLCLRTYSTWKQYMQRFSLGSCQRAEIYNYKHGHDKATKRIRSKAETKSQEPQYHLTNVCAMSQHCRYCSLHQPRLCEPTCKMIANPPQPQASDEGVVAMILDTYYKVCIEYIPGWYGHISPVGKLVDGVAGD